VPQTSPSPPITTEKAPRVSVGLVVFNGENYIDQAIRSIRAQTFEDFELIISDNGSTDGTREICEFHANEDPRIRYLRSEVNRGVAWNMNNVINQARAPYFKLACHDDEISPTFLERCIEILDAQPDVVCAYTYTINKRRLSNRKSYVIRKYLLDDEPASSRVEERFRYLIGRQYWVSPVFGVIRHPLLARAGQFRDMHSADVALLIHLGMYGRFHQVPEFLFIRRFHNEQVSELLKGDAKTYYASWNTAKKRTFGLPLWKFLGVQISAILRPPLTIAERLRCTRVLFNWVGEKRGQLLKELLSIPAQRKGKTDAQGKILGESK